jgi:hypothetical protein
LLRKMRRKMCIYKCMLNVYKNQQNRQTGSRNLMGPKTLPTIWGTYMKLVTKYQISAINSCWEKCDENYLGRTEGRMGGQTEGRTEVKQYTPLPLRGAGVYKSVLQKILLKTSMNLTSAVHKPSDPNQCWFHVSSWHQDKFHVQKCIKRQNKKLNQKILGWNNTSPIFCIIYFRNRYK